MKNNEKYNELLSEGFSEKTLGGMSEKQIDVLHSKIFAEATYKVAADNVDKIKDKVDSDDTVEVHEQEFEDDENEVQEYIVRLIQDDEYSESGKKIKRLVFSDRDQAERFVVMSSATAEKMGIEVDHNLGDIIGDEHREEELNEEPDFTKPVSPDKGWKQDTHSKQVADNRVDKADGTLNSVKFVEKGGQAKEVSKLGHTGFAQPNEKINIGGKKAGSKSTSGSSMNESQTTKKELVKYIQGLMESTNLLSETEMPEFMELDIFKGKGAEIFADAPVETPVKPTVKPGEKPGKPLIKPKHRPKPKAEKEVEVMENGRTLAGGDETKGGLRKQRGSKHPKMKK